MSDPIFAFPFDPTGTAATNRIQGERTPISPPGWSEFYFVIPRAAPFFRESLRVYLHGEQGGGRLLAEGVDYYPSHRFHDASLAVGKPIYGSITLFDKTVAGVAEFEYQTIGGQWTIDEATIIEILSNKLTNPRITTWEQVVDLPDRFPVIDHEWDLVDMVGMSSVVDKLSEIRDAIIASGEGGLGDHLADFNNPHQTTKAQVGLGDVQNYPIASLPQAVQGTDNSTYMTPLRTAQQTNVLAVVPLQAHKDDTDNPHDVTKAQVGLGDVQNYPVSTQPQAEGGTHTASYLTPLRGAQLIDVRAMAPLNTHVNARNNPHQVTALQVGLGNVQNYPMSSLQEAREGLLGDKYMSPVLVREAVTSMVGSDLNNHVNNTNNPHQVTKGQVGLGSVQNYPMATLQQMLDGTATNAYVSPQNVKQAVDGGVGVTVSGHINNTSNPHQVTKGQVGLGNVDNFRTATQQDMVDGISDQAFATPLGVKQAIAALGGGSVEAHAARTDNPHLVTAAQVGAYTIAQVDTALTGKLDVNGTAANSVELGGLGLDEVVELSKVLYKYVAIRSFEEPDPLGGPPIVRLGGPTWSLLGKYDLMGTEIQEPVVVFITGGESKLSTATTQVVLYLNPAAPETSTYAVLTGAMPEWSLAYREVDDRLELWMANAVERNSVSVLVSRMSSKSFDDGVESEPVETEPTDLAYLYVTPMPAPPPEPAFKMNFLTMVDSSDGDAVIAADAYAAPMQEDYHYFTQSRFINTGFSGDGGSWTAPAANRIFYNAAIHSEMAVLSGPERAYGYTYEVEIEGGGTDGAAGVCLAYIVDPADGKRKGLYALRTDGSIVNRSVAGTLPGGDIYKLLSVGYNLFQDDAVDLGSTSAVLEWGDGVLDADRATAGPYVPVTNVWGTLGKFRMRVTVGSSTILIETTEFGSTDYASGPSVTLDISALNSTHNGLLSPFFNPTGWGLAHFELTGCTYDVLNRPGKFRRQLRRPTASSSELTGLTVRTYTGSAWNTEFDFNLWRNALIYSEIDSTLWFSRPDGSIKRLQITT